ncbi:MAG: DUF4062 domain-containing protein [Pusillimonas sp.]
MKTKVFVSSTIFDLIDIRSEVFQTLTEMGFTPIMSEIWESSFKIPEFENSIEACLQNIKISDVAIFILSQRYGPSLKNAGFSDVSATELEYDEAVKNKKPIFFYIRDKLEADYTIWKRNQESQSMNLAWIKKEDFKIFLFLEKHRKLHQLNEKSNWISIFRNSIEIKEMLKRDLGSSARKSNFKLQIRNGQVPVLYTSVECEYLDSKPLGAISVKCIVENSSVQAAYNINTRWIGLTKKQNNLKNVEIPILPPGKSTLACFIYYLHPQKLEVTDTLQVKYETSDGNKIIDYFEVNARIQYLNNEALIFSSGNLISKKYFVEKEREIRIEEYSA